MEEAVLLAETIAAVEASKSSTAADEVSKAGRVLHSINNMYSTCTCTCSVLHALIVLCMGIHMDGTASVGMSWAGGFRDTGSGKMVCRCSENIVHCTMLWVVLWSKLHMILRDVLVM